MEIGKNKIRIIFYSGTITIVLILLTLLGGTYISSFRTQTEIKIDQLATGIYDMKKSYVKDIINRTIQDIDIERELILASQIESLSMAEQIIQSITVQNSDAKQLYNHIVSENITFQEIQLLIYDRNQQLITYQINSENPINIETDETTFLSMYPVSELTRLIEQKDYYTILRVNPDYIEEVVKYNVTHRIRKEVLIDNGYIWINYILDYNGGDDYAIRLVHPNLPETEGSFLSTNTLDKEGNQAYLDELEGVKKDGELFQDYYFKKKDSEEIAHKLSYARLYEPYDWVIATGVYLDDVDTLVVEETSDMNATQKTFITKTLFLIGLCLLLAITLIYFFEKLIGRLIQRFQDEVNQKNEELIIEKNRMEEIAYIDSLTGLLTRRAMESNLEKAHASALRHNISYAVGIGDIDFFKKINDQYGHHAGDYILTSLADLFKGHLRIDDSISRWGGEEFLFLLNNTSAEDAFINMDRLRTLVENTEFEFENQKISVSISIGVTGYTPDFKNYDIVLKKADKLLYDAKTTGRNKVMI